MSFPAASTSFPMGSMQQRPQIRFGAHPRFAVVQRTADGSLSATLVPSTQPSQPDSNSSDMKEPFGSGSSVHLRAQAESDDVFGPTHPLHPLVAAHLPDVLARIVLAYQSPLLPRQKHYRGHTLLQYGAYGFRDQRQPHTATNALSLARRSFSWSGWMARSANHRHRNHFLLSFESHVHDGQSYWLHIGYRKHYVRHNNAEQNAAFTFAFFANDLDARPADTDLALVGEWEHWSGSFEYPRPQTTPPTPLIPNTNESYHSEGARNPPAGTLPGRRKLYRNGVLVIEDDCIPLTAAESSTLVLGNYQNNGHGMTLDGGVCDVRLYSRVLSDVEMRALYEGEEHEVSAEGLEAHWPLESDKHISPAEGTERLMLDVSGNERHLVVRSLNRHGGVQSRYQLDGQL